MEELLKALIDIQQNLNAPKGQYNNFGKFNYRSLEDIEAAIKPFLAKHSCGIRFSDEIEDHCNRTFVKTTLTFFNCKGESITTTAVAENVSEKSGMDGAQITGAASSYARKYAMNAMFAIDDTKDADTNQYHDQTRQATAKPATSRRGSKAAPAQAPQPQDRFSVIKNAIASTPDTDALLDLYLQHQNEVESNVEIKALFTARKQQLKQAA